MNIKFSPPDITEREIDEVVDALKSGWITTGPKTKKFEKQIAEFCGTTRAVCLNSATAGLELILKMLGIGAGDEVITSAYTYTASASVIDHVGAKIVLCDVAKDSYHMDYAMLESLITPKTKAIIAVDIAGIVTDYDVIYDIVERKASIFEANSPLQSLMGRCAVVGDCAHSFGASKCGVMAGNIADFSSFSFHAVKNLTTAEGGAVTWRTFGEDIDRQIYDRFLLWCLHGQNKDALAKTKIGAWEYDIKILGNKCNMTDVLASIGMAQLSRYDQMLARRREIIAKYDHAFRDLPLELLEHYGAEHNGTGHLYLTRVAGVDELTRNEIIVKMAERGVATNVHYKPLPMMTAYKELGFDIADYPNAYAQYCNEITLPLHSVLTDEEVEYVIDSYTQVLKEYV